MIRLTKTGHWPRLDILDGENILERGIVELFDSEQLESCKSKQWWNVFAWFLRIDIDMHPAIDAVTWSWDRQSQATLFQFSY